MSKIAIVGSGIAGLTTAYYLKTAQPNHTIHLYEKEETVGGRIQTKPQNNCFVDIGAQFLTDQDVEAFQLVHSLQLEQQLQQMNMDITIQHQQKQYPINPEKLSRVLTKEETKEITQLQQVLQHLETLFSEPMDENAFEPYLMSTFHEWYEEHIGQQLLWYYNTMIRALSFTTDENVSALYGLIIILALTGQCYSFQHGLQELVSKLLTTITPDKLNNNTKVSEIISDNNSIIINDERYDNVILSTPLNEAQKLLNLNTYNIKYSSCSYLIIQLKKQCWNAGYAILPELSSPISFLSNETKKFQTKKNYHDVIGVIIPHQDNHQMHSEKQIVKLALNEINKQFPVDEEDIETAEIYHWKHALPICSPSFHTKQQQLAELDLDRIHLCGDYMSLPSLDGAIESGRKLAASLSN